MTVRIVECYDLCVGYQLGLVVGIYSCHIPTNSHHPSFLTDSQTKYIDGLKRLYPPLRIGAPGN